MSPDGLQRPVEQASPKLDGSSRTDSPAKTREAAEQFEALLIASMLQTCRQGDAWFGSGGDSASDTALGYAEEHFARALAAQGGLGIARLVLAGLNDQNLPYATAAGIVTGDTKAAGVSSDGRP
jgi:Rod binding domain-containing protein